MRHEKYFFWEIRAGGTHLYALNSAGAAMNSGKGAVLHGAGLKKTFITGISQYD